jgi:malate dehydrogenase (oxaloacetate-decarboxylating)(NADP+)
MEAYRQHLTRFVYQTGMFMRPVFTAAKLPPPSAWPMPKARTSACCAPRRLAVDEGLARPILVGRPAVIEARIPRPACA